MNDQPTRSLCPHGKSPADQAAAATPGVNEPTAAPHVPTLADSAASLPATAAGRYQFLEEIARGGMGIVYRATDTVLDREVAVKVLGERFEPESAAAHRFLDEARIAGQLQHPGIPAVHDLGALPDGRPFLAMKLVKGNTLDALLANRVAATAERGRFVAVFEQICQAIGYAHAHQVIHRDLKPANVMVGSFGEVQVMDWGLAKVLSPRREPERPEWDCSTLGTEIRSLRDSDGSETQAGSVLGTPAFMPPEQAIGAVDQIDARSDVFGLGAILAVILTGQPPFVGDTAESTRQAAAKGKVADAFGRLDACGAEPDLVLLCKRCLAAEKDERPASGGAVATAVAGLRAAADERARQAELDRVRAEGERAKAEAETHEQRKRRRVQLALAAAIILLLLGSGAFAWRQAERGRELHERDGRNAEAVKGLLDQCEASLRDNDAAKAAVALEAAQKRAAEGGADDLAGRLGRCEQDLAVLRELDAVDQFRWTALGSRFPAAEAVAAQYREALGRFGADPNVVGAEAAAARVSASSVRQRLVAALDRLLRSEKTDEVRAALRVADADPYRDAVRDAVQMSYGAVPAALGVTPAPAAVAELGGRPDALLQPPGFAAFLGDSGAVQLERRRELLATALRRRPGDLGLLMALGFTYPIDHKEGAEERARWFQAAVAVAPMNNATHNNLGIALHDKRDMEAAIAEFREALHLTPNYAPAHHNLGHCLRDNKDLEGAIAEYREAIRSDPKHVIAPYSLGLALRDKNDLEGAIAAFREAIRLDANNIYAHTEMGVALYGHKDLEGAIAEYREAIRLDPKYAVAHSNLMIALQNQKGLAGGIAEYREVIRLDPKNAMAHSTLALALYYLKDLDGAIVEYREAIRLDPNYCLNHSNLGSALTDKNDLEGAIAECREAIRLDPKEARAHNNLGWALENKGDMDGAIAAYREALRLEPQKANTLINLPRAERMRELTRRLPDVLAGRAEPKTPAEGCEFAQLCVQSFQNRFAASARLYDAAFTADPKVADDLVAEHRYSAACYAARAARGDGVDAPTDAGERAGLRAKALVWLRADLALRRQQAASSSAAEQQTAAEKLTHWLGDKDLSGVRPGVERIGMTDAERADWDKFWTEVRATRDEALKPPPREGKDE